jgi:hypothetical protein
MNKKRMKKKKMKTFDNNHLLIEVSKNDIVMRKIMGNETTNKFNIKGVVYH